MKRLVISAFCLTFSLGGYAQETQTDTLKAATDTVKNHKVNKVVIEFGGWEHGRKSKKSVNGFSSQFTFSRVDLGLSTYLDQGSYNLSSENSYLDHDTWRSSNFGFDFFQMGYRFNKNFKVYLSSGLDWNHIRLNRDITFQRNKPLDQFVTEDVHFEKNRFSSQYLRIPLSFQLRSNLDHKGKRMYFVFGPEVGLLLNGKIKQVSDERGKEKFKGKYNFEPFRYGTFVRMGYGGMGVFAKYYFNDVFVEDRGPKDFKNLSFGFMFGF
ncbi:MAG TPA: PorT family protein [Daejeonella sp.]|nr:PorT family protein [Daejeonella sp.]